MSFFLSMLMMPVAIMRKTDAEAKTVADRDNGEGAGANWLELSEIAAFDPGSRWYCERARHP